MSASPVNTAVKPSKVVKVIQQKPKKKVSTVTAPPLYSKAEFTHDYDYFLRYPNSHKDNINKLSESNNSLEILDINKTFRAGHLAALIQTVCNLGKQEFLTTLSVSGLALTAIPSTIIKLTGLKKLDISMTAITTLPETIASMESLEELSVSQNYFLKVPKFVHGMQIKKEVYDNAS